jgi:hypothetical protein
MAARKSKQIDIRNFVIAALVLVVGVQTYFLYQSNSSFREFFVRDPKSTPAPKKVIKKKIAQAPRVDTAPSHEPKAAVAPVATIKTPRKMRLLAKHQEPDYGRCPSGSAAFQ